MKKAVLGVCAVMATAAVTAEPVVSDVTFEQDPASRRVTITYSLSDEPAIVTVDILTNGVSIGENNLTHFAGDVNRVVSNGADEKTVYWYPDKAWPDHKVDAAVARVTAWATNAPPDYMVLDLSDGRMTYYTSTNCLPDGGLANDVYRTEKIVFRKIPARGVTWRMGSPTGELGRADDETPHLVTLTQDYWFGIYPVTMGQHKMIKGDNSPFAPAISFFTNLSCYATRPITGVGMKSLRSWTANYWPAAGHAIDGGTHLSALRDRVGGVPFDLPTEAQWEYAARAGVGTALTTGKNITSKVEDSQLDELGRYWKNCELADSGSFNASIRANDDASGTSKVGIYKPNRWGIYDIHGNVAELCLDWYAAYSGDLNTVQTNPKGAEKTSGGKYVARGGFWGYTVNNGAACCRLASRRQAENESDAVVSFRHFGYRLCLEIP